MAISVQLAANLTNTYFDYKNGVDIVDERQTKYRLDRGLANGTVSEQMIVTSMIAFYGIAIFSIMPMIMAAKGWHLLGVFCLGLSLAFFYTANPFGIGGLKYRAMGDICIFLCFGPLLMQCVSLLITGSINTSLNLYCIPIGLLTEAILHANNSRDIKTDMKAGAVTLAGLIGIERSYVLYIGLFAGAYLTSAVIVLYHHWGCLLTFVTIPIAVNLVNHFSRRELDCLPQMTSKLHLPFGLLFFAGIMLTKNGLLHYL